MIECMMLYKPTYFVYFFRDFKGFVYILMVAQCYLRV